MNSYLPYVGWVTIVMIGKPIINVCFFLLIQYTDWPGGWTMVILVYVKQLFWEMLIEHFISPALKWEI
jgi:hypothetical protein